MRPLSYILMITLALATGGQAVVHGNRNGYRYNGPAHKYLPAEGASSTDNIGTSGHWQPQEVEERERNQQLPNYPGNQVNRPGQWQQQQGGQQETSIGQSHQQGYRQEQQRVPSYVQREQSLQEVEYAIHQQRPQGFSQYQGHRQGESSLGPQHQESSPQQQQSENHWESSNNHQQQGSQQQLVSHQPQQHQSENPWDSSYNQQQQGSRHQLGSHQQQHQLDSHWHSAYKNQQQGSRQQQPQNPWESSYDHQQQESNQHNQGSVHQNEGSHQHQIGNNWSSLYGQQLHGSQNGANEQQGSHQQPENHWSSSVNQHNSQGSRWQNQPSFSPSVLESLHTLPFAHAHANSKKTLAIPTNHINNIPGYTLSSNPEHERFIGLDADDNRLLTQSLPFQSPSSPFRPSNNYLQQQEQHQQRPSSFGHSNFLQMQSQSYELPPTHHTQRGWVASAQADSHPNQPNRQFQPPY